MNEIPMIQDQFLHVKFLYEWKKQEIFTTQVRKQKLSIAKEISIPVIPTDFL